MKIRELIQALSAFDPDEEVFTINTCECCTHFCELNAECIGRRDVGNINYRFVAQPPAPKPKRRTSTWTKSAPASRIPQVLPAALASVRVGADRCGDRRRELELLPCSRGGKTMTQGNDQRVGPHQWLNFAPGARSDDPP